MKFLHFFYERFNFYFIIKHVVLLCIVKFKRKKKACEFILILYALLHTHTHNVFFHLILYYLHLLKYTHAYIFKCIKV
jgi:hypothetical protein